MTEDKTPRILKPPPPKPFDVHYDYTPLEDLKTAFDTSTQSSSGQASSDPNKSVTVLHTALCLLYDTFVFTRNFLQNQLIVDSVLHYYCRGSSKNVLYVWLYGPSLCRLWDVMASQLHALLDVPPWRPGGKCKHLPSNVSYLSMCVCATAEHAIIDVHWLVGEDPVPSPR